MECIETTDDYLYVVSVISNPARFKRRYQLFNEYQERMSKNPKVKLYTTELQLGKRPFVTNATFKIRSDWNLWHKENLINYTMARLPESANYIAWVDADIEFLNKEWAEETIEKLQEFNIVQPWASAIDMGPNQEIIQTHESFCSVYHKNCRTYKAGKGYTYPHPGYSFAFRKDILNKIGGMIDFAIVGSGDHHMATAFIGQVEKSIHNQVHYRYREKLIEYQKLCNRFVQKKIGFVHGIIIHHFHGKKKDRQYTSRWNILIKNDFNPDTDISYDLNRLFQFNGNKPELELEIQSYSYSRNEDSVDL